jgi:hypothetical protein
VAPWTLAADRFDRSSGSVRRPLVTVAIVNWNTRDLLRGCLASLPWGSPALGLDVVVVDNASRDDSAALVRREFPQVRLIHNRANVGFVRANNQALAAGRGDHFLMLNSDTEVQAGAIETLVAAIAAAPGCGAVGPRLLNSDGSIQGSAGMFPRMRQRFAPGVLEAAYAAELEHRLAAGGGRAAVDWLCGAAVLTTRAVLNRVGPLDERYFMWYDDVDWSRKLARAGLARLLVAQAVIVHHGRQSGGQLANRVLAEQLWRSEYTYLRLNDGRLAAAAAWSLRVAKAGCNWLTASSPEARAEAAWRLAAHRRLRPELGQGILRA